MKKLIITCLILIIAGASHASEQATKLAKEAVSSWSTPKKLVTLAAGAAAVYWLGSKAWGWYQKNRAQQARLAAQDLLALGVNGLAVGTIQKALDAGADPNGNIIGDDQQLTKPLLAAVQHPDRRQAWSVIQALLKAGADHSICTDDTQATLLHLYAGHAPKDESVFQPDDVLIINAVTDPDKYKDPININQQDSLWCTALHYAAIQGNWSVVHALVTCKHGKADADIKDKSGRRALDYAQWPDIKKILKDCTLSYRGHNCPDKDKADQKAKLLPEPE